MGNTEVIGTRVSEGYKQRFADMCVKIGATPREVIENLVDDYFECKFSISGGHIDSENGLLTRVSEDFDDSVNSNSIPVNSDEYYDFGFDVFVKILRNKEYPDEYIKKFVDNITLSAYEMPKFNPKRVRDDWA